MGLKMGKLERWETWERDLGSGEVGEVGNIEG